MTTIAWKTGTLAADSLCTDDNTAILVTKAMQRADGDVAGAAGNIDQCAGFIAWWSAGMKGDPPPINEIAAIFTVNGLPYIMSGGLPGTPLKSYAAVGSGSQGALAAMKLGHSPEEAVAAVSGVDPSTGGPIDVFRVKQRAARKRANNRGRM